ncbi:hypothetical protein L210DRAFT_3760254 [Boletus edulis BED1]|uniref:F-box domain-containing protein n=2 Tax=Boletus edulis BED1 TaxID=1328754 RepID=A0AAD4BWU7_BOLED|nr:hypothetical protein L210DRAFT_3760254 [Boletus edulis BED1]
MHHALKIQEILFNIFGHCDQCTDQASLARTCHAFKEPALDMLWETLPHDLSPLARCLPEASHPLTPQSSMWYMFTRPLMRTEWEILRSYTRRIRRIVNFEWGLDEKSVEILTNPPTTEPLFPNLRHLGNCWGSHSGSRIVLVASRLLPNVTKIHLRPSISDVSFSKSVSDWICRWQNLQSVHCTDVILDVDALTHLSRLPTFTQLECNQIITLPDCVSPLSFSNLTTLELWLTSLGPVLPLLSWIQLPAIKKLYVRFDICPSKQELPSILAAVQTSNANQTINDLRFNQLSCNSVRSEAYLLCLADLQPWMSFGDLRHIYLNVEWNVGLTDNDILILASAWPNLEDLSINDGCGWNAPSGITTNGLLRLLQTCRSLRQVALVMDTQGDTKLPPANLGFTLPPDFTIDVLDSAIEEESVPAIAAFFAALKPSPNVHFDAWSSGDMVKPPGWEVYRDRWLDVCSRSNICHFGSTGSSESGSSWTTTETET